MFSVGLSIRECGGRVVVGLSGELDVADAVSVAASLAAVAAGQPQIIHVRPSVDQAAGEAREPARPLTHVQRKS